MFLSRKLIRRGVPVDWLQHRFYSRRNPGVGRRLKIFQQETPDLSQQPTEKDFDDSEVDINSRALVEEYDREYSKISKRIAFQRVEREYFDRKKLPNFLLWSEKEQIRQLYHSEPDKWTHDTLSQSFPALPYVIKKILKSQWTIKDAQAIKKHDQKVIANWKAFMKKKIDLPPLVAGHLSKFTARERLHPAEGTSDLMMLGTQKQNQDMLVPTKSTQFLDIVRKNQARDAVDDNCNNDIGDNSLKRGMPSPPSETYVLRGPPSKELPKGHLTLSEMRKAGGLPPRSDTADSHTQPETTTDVVSPPTGKRLTSQKSKGVLNPIGNDGFPTSRYAYAEKSIKDPNDEIEDFPLKITIPKDKWKKGAVYRVNNCFYADDGEFLYKV